MEPRDKNRLDQWLDHALQHYGDAEPRPGLEARILANLAVSSDRVPARTRWAIAFASVAAIAVVAVVLWSGGGLLHDDKTSEKTLHPPVVETQNEKRAQTIPVLHREGTSDHRRRIAKSSRAATKASAPPHLNQFPSPRPLSEQEQLLETYVRQFPKEAAIVAREQAQRKKELEALYSSATTVPDSEQER